MPDLSIIICTYSRYGLLRDNLTLLSNIGYTNRYEVLVVDNTDDARQRSAFADECRRSFPSIQVLDSAPPGLSRARNVGLKAARSQVIAYLDDDAYPREGWAESLLASFSDPSILWAGGPIEPKWEQPPEAWIPSELYGAFTVLNLGPQSRCLGADEFVFGANMAFRKSALEQIGGFDEHTGRVRNNLQGEEDLDVQRKLRPFGVGFYAADAIVHHLVPSERCTIGWLARRFAWQGFSERIEPKPEMSAYQRRLFSDGLKDPILARATEALIGRPSDPADALRRLQFLRSFVGLLFYEAGEFYQSAPAPVVSEESPSTDPGLFALLGSDAFRMIRDRTIFVEFGISHRYLYGALANVGDCALVNPQCEPWAEPERAREILKKVVALCEGRGCKALVLVTLDWICYDHIATQILVNARNLSIHAILHRVPVTASAAARARELLGVLDSVFVFSKQIKNEAERFHRLFGLKVLNHPPVFYLNGLPRQNCVRPKVGRTVLALVGEARPGKGHEFVISTLGKSDSQLKRSIELSILGGATNDMRRRLKAAVKQSGIKTDFRVHERTADDYRGVSDGEFMSALERAHIALFPYHDDEAQSFSGHLVDAVLAGCRIMVARQSVMRTVVEEYDLGSVFDINDTQSFIRALNIERQAEPSKRTDKAHQFIKDFSAPAAATRLREAVESANASRQRNLHIQFEQERSNVAQAPVEAL